MSGIHDLISTHVKNELERMLVTELMPDEEDEDQTIDDAIPGVVKLGPLQGDPDPDEARISIEVYENDPDQEISGSAMGRTNDPWEDTVYDIEIGGAITWRRNFTVKARCLFDRTQESLTDARRIASTVRSRIEKGLLSIRFNGIATDTESVVRGAVSEMIRGSMVQLGGPPDAYDYQIKVRFEILTTEILRG